MRVLRARTAATPDFFAATESAAAQGFGAAQRGETLGMADHSEATSMAMRRGQMGHEASCAETSESSHYWCSSMSFLHWLSRSEEEAATPLAEFVLQATPGGVASLDMERELA